MECEGKVRNVVTGKCEEMEETKDPLLEQKMEEIKNEEIKKNEESMKLLENYVNEAFKDTGGVFHQKVGPVVKAACDGLSSGGKRKTRKRRRKRGGELGGVDDAKNKVMELTPDQKMEFIKYAKPKLLENTPPYLTTDEEKLEKFKTYCSTDIISGGRRRRRRSRKRKSRKRRKTRRKRRKSRRKSRRRKRRTKRRR